MKLKTETGELLVLDEGKEAYVAESSESSTVVTVAEAEEMIEKGELEMVAEESDEVVEASDPKAKAVKTKKKKIAGSGEVMEDEDEEDGDESDEDEEDEVDETSKKVAKEEVEITVDVTEDVNALFAGQELSEDFKAKTTLVFETAVKAKVKEQLVSIEETFEAKLVEQSEVVLAEVSSKLNDYLDYMIEEWMTENKLSVEAGLKNQILEGFVGGMQDLFAEHYIEIPEEKYNVVDEQAKEIDSLKVSIDEEIGKNVEARTALNVAHAAKIFSEISEDLTLTQVEKLKTLAEGVEFESSKDYAEKLTTLKETYFPSENAKEEVIAEVAQTKVNEKESGEMSESMKRIVESLSNTKNKSIFGA
jgi:hypothetical protein